ncbi:hypothetical protein COCOBI_12-1460 [Coccomyxa sp. Obi]|nr:hypothetical protein COCOBI_12-1460 [Coccomyxa sp. Obi]
MEGEWKWVNEAKEGAQQTERGIVNSIKKAGEWKWVNEAKEGAQQVKWGMVSSQPGDELLLRISRSRKHSRASVGLGQALLSGQSGESSSLELNSSVVVGLGLLKSYQDVGAAAVGCSGGCDCKPQRFELLHRQQVSQVYWFYIFVEMLPQPNLAQECLMSITVEPSANPNGGSKVKVTSLMVSEDDRAENGKMFTVLDTTDAEGNNSG